MLRAHHRTLIALLFLSTFDWTASAQWFRVSNAPCDTVVVDDGQGHKSVSIIPLPIEPKASTNSVQKGIGHNRFPSLESVLKEQESVFNSLSVQITRSLPSRDYSSYSTGAIPIEESVSPSGARLYSVPVTTAAGWHLTPGISLAYNSQAGNNVAGYGWGISGLSSISVRNKVQYYDGQNIGAIYDSVDASYSLDGIPLVQSELGLSGYSLATARGNIQVKEHGTNNGRAAYFTALYPNGTQATFGFVDNTQPQTTYPITQITDLEGNVISFSYSYYDGYYYITSIEYGVNASIVFSYSTRNDGTPYQFSQAGKYVSYPKRLLKTVSSKDGSTVICQYSLTHELLDGVSLLKEIHCTSGSSELPPLLFEYGMDSVNGNTTPSFNLDDYNYFPTYYSNSGGTSVTYKRGKLIPGSLDDCVISLPSLDTYAKKDSTWSIQALGYCFQYGSLYNANQQILCNFTGDYSFSQQVVLAEEGFQLIEPLDVDMDGVDELVKINNGSTTAGVTTYKITIYKFNSNGIYNSNYFTVSVNDGTHNAVYNNPVKSYYRFGNFRGNGKPMLLIMTRNASKFALVDLNAGTKVSEASLFTNGDDEENLVLVADFENDGKEDLCHITASGMDVYSLSTETSTTFSYRTTYSGVTKSLLYREPNYQVNGVIQEVKARLYTVDLNGDGYTDIAAAPLLELKVNNLTIYSDTWNIARFNGKSFSTEGISLLTRGKDDNVVFLDADKDGLPDIIHLHFSNVCYCPNINGVFTSSFYHTQLSVSNDSDLVAGDSSLFGKSGDILVISGPEIKQYSFSINHSERRVVNGLSDSFGVLHTNQYKSCRSSSGAYLIDNSRTFSSANGFKRGRIPLFVLYGSQQYLNNQTIASVFYTYWDIVYHTKGLGVCGFGQIRSTDYINTVNTCTVLNPEKFGIVEQVATTMNYMGAPYNTIVNSYDNNSTTYGKLNPRLISSVATDTLTGIEASSTYSYGNYDLLTSVLTSRRIGSGTAQTEQVKRTYENSVSLSKYVLGVITEESVIREGDGSSTLKWKEKSVTTYDSYYRPLTNKKYVGRYGIIRNPDLPIPIDDSLIIHGTLMPGGLVEPQVVNDSLRIIDPILDFISFDATNLVSETRWQYDTHGNVISETTAPYGATTFIGNAYTYDSNGRYVTSTTNALGRSVSYNNYNKFGQPGVIVNDRSQSTYYTYDNWGNIISVTHPDGAIEQNSVAWGGAGLYTSSSTVTGRPENVIHYDALGREIRIGEKRFDGQWQWVDKEYNDKGLLYRTSLPYRGTSAAYWNTYTYDQYNRPLSLTEASGKLSSWSYNGTSVTTIKDGITSTSTTDANGNVVSVTDAGGTITYTLRDDGQPSKVTAPGNVSTTFTYDDYGRRTKIVDPSAGTQSDAYLWNSDGSSRIIHTGPNGTVKTYRDTYGRTTLIERPGEYNTTYTYDSDGRLSTEQSSNGTGIEYTYDSYDRIVTTKETVPDGKWLKKVYGRSVGSIVTSVQYISQSDTITTETYNYANGHNTGITLSDGTVVWSLTSENDFGMPTAITTGTISREYGYTAFGLPTYRRMDNGDLQDFTYQFDVSTGNLLSRSDLVNGQTETFGYDNLNRLVAMGSRQISYAANGNILSMDGVGTMTYGTSTRPYRITMLEPEEDDLVPNRQQSVSYTCYNRPSVLTEGGRSAAFTYNGDGDRVKMNMANSTSNVLTRYYIGGRYEYDQTPNGTKELLYLGGDAYSAPMVYQKVGSGSWTAYNIGRDYLGNITHIATTSGTLVAEYSYDPWGRLRDPETLDIYPVGYEPELFFGRGYTGHEHLTWFGLVNMNARLYDPLLGRFLSPDPYVQAPDFTQSFNRYSYALNNPLRYTDESGEYVFWDDFLSGLVGGTINWVVNGCQFTKEGLAFFVVGAAAGVASLYISPVAVAGVMAATNSIIRQGIGDDGEWSLKNVNLATVLKDGAIGLATSYFGGQLSSLLSNSLGEITSMIPGKAWEGLVNRGLTGAGVGFVMGSGISALNQWGQYKETGEYDWDAVWNGGWRAALTGLASGAISGMAEGVMEARAANENPWGLTSNDTNPSHIAVKYKSLGAKSRDFSLKKANEAYLKQNGIDPHLVKYEYLGHSAQISRYDLYYSKNGQIFIYGKNGMGEPTPTSYWIHK